MRKLTGPANGSQGRGDRPVAPTGHDCAQGERTPRTYCRRAASMIFR